VIESFSRVFHAPFWLFPLSIVQCRCRRSAVLAVTTIFCVFYLPGPIPVRFGFLSLLEFSDPSGLFLQTFHQVLRWEFPCDFRHRFGKRDWNGLICWDPMPFLTPFGGMLLGSDGATVQVRRFGFHRSDGDGFYLQSFFRALALSLPASSSLFRGSAFPGSSG